jgi:hypothetical protein
MTQPPRPDDDQYQLSTLIRRVLSVGDVGLRRRQMERHLLTVDAATAAAHLEALFGPALSGDFEAAEVLFALFETLLKPEGKVALAVEAVQLEARRSNGAALGWFLLDPPPYRTIDLLRAKGGGDRSKSLGERRAEAAGWNTALLERLLDDPDPMVIERLAANPRLTERQVVTLVSTRPNRAERLEAVMAVSRWNRKAEVRSSVAQNPYAPTGLAIRALMFASRGDLDRIRFAGDLHPLLREAAAFFATLRDRTAPAD